MENTFNDLIKPFYDLFQGKLKLPNDYLSFVISPPNGKNAILRTARHFLNSMMVGHKNFDGEKFSGVEQYDGGRVNDIFERSEDYHETFIVSENRSFYYLEYWEDLSVLMIPKSVILNDIYDDLSAFSQSSIKYLESRAKNGSEEEKNYMEILFELSQTSY